MVGKPFWFKQKKYGYGWTPASREGWFITLIYIVIVVWASFSITEEEFDISYFKFIFLLTVLFILIAWKTGEKPRWRWGKKKR